MDWLNYHHLHYFWVVAREGSVTKACDILHLSQPTISGQIRELEKAMKAPLFAKSGRGLALTETGQAVFRYADHIAPAATPIPTAMSKSDRNDRDMIEARLFRCDGEIEFVRGAGLHVAGFFGRGIELGREEVLFDTLLVEWPRHALGGWDALERVNPHGFATDADFTFVRAVFDVQFDRGNPRSFIEDDLAAGERVSVQGDFAFDIGGRFAVRFGAATDRE